MEAKETFTIERRQHPRWEWAAELQGVYLDSRGNRVMENLISTDISKGGIGLTGQGKYRLGQHFVICLPEPDGRTHCVHAKVVVCRANKEATHLGLEFSKTPRGLGLWLNSKIGTAA